MTPRGTVDEPPSLRRAQLLIALQAGLSVAVGVVLVAVVTYLVAVNRLDADLTDRLEQAALHGSLTDLPSEIWRVEIDPAGTRQASPGAPSGYPTPAQITASAEQPLLDEVHLGTDREYLTWTSRVNGQVVQTGIAYRHREDERHRLLLGLGVAGAVASLVAALFGLLLGRRAMAPLHEAVQRQRRFVADASHELRTPLSRLALRAELLRRDLRSGTDPGDLTADGDALVTEARRLSEVIDDLLLSAQLGGDPRAGELVDLGGLATRLVAADRQRAAQRQITLTARTTPAPAVHGISVSLTRALAALVDNALRHAPVGGTVVVEVAPDRTETSHAADGAPEHVTVTVTDDGPGLEGQALDDLLTRFARGEGGRHGLGLSLVREVLLAHDGTLTAEQADPHGARFVVRLPAARQPLKDHGPDDDR